MHFFVRPELRARWHLWILFKHAPMFCNSSDNVVIVLASKAVHPLTSRWLYWRIACFGGRLCLLYFLDFSTMPPCSDILLFCKKSETASCAIRIWASFEALALLPPLPFYFPPLKVWPLFRERRCRSMLFLVCFLNFVGLFPWRGCKLVLPCFLAMY